MMKIKKTIVIRITLFLLVCFNIQAQQEGTKVIDNKGTLKSISKVFSNNATPTPITNNVEGDIWYDTSASNTIIKIWDDNVNNTNIPGWRYLSGNNWLLTGNSNASSTNFLGTINDVRLQLRSNNTPLLELGRRSTLGLPTNIFPDAPVVHIKNGGSPYATIEFEAPNINSHGKPIIRASNDNFVIRSGIRNNDYFQIRSVANTPSDGSLEFEIGDDGNEPFVFKSFSNNGGGINTPAIKELFRVQGSDTSPGYNPRFGINTNGTMANSTLQVEGSVSKSIFEITSGPGNFNLTEDHHTIIVKTNRTIVLPNANTCEGRIYVIKNVSGGSLTCSSYNDERDSSSTSIADKSVLWVQSNGAEWDLISKFSGPRIVASAKVEMTYTGFYNNYSSHSISKQFNISSITRINRGDYQVTFASAMPDDDYVIQLSIKDCASNCPGYPNTNYDDPGITYYNQTVNGFRINIGDSDNGGSPKNDIDLEFMFSVINW